MRRRLVLIMLAAALAGCAAHQREAAVRTVYQTVGYCPDAQVWAIQPAPPPIDGVQFLAVCGGRRYQCPPTGPTSGT